MAKITTQRLAPAGADLTFVSASAGGDSYDVEQGNFIAVRNTGASPVTVTIKAKKACSHGTLHDSAVTVNAGATKVIGNLTKDRFADPTTGLGEITYSAVTNVSVAVYCAD